MSLSHLHSGTTDPGIVTELWFAGKVEPLLTRESGNIALGSQRPWLALIFGAAALTGALIVTSLLIHFSPPRTAVKGVLADQRHPAHGVAPVPVAAYEPSGELLEVR